jgi:hypothetical protein
MCFMGLNALAFRDGGVYLLGALTRCLGQDSLGEQIVGNLDLPLANYPNS